MPPPREESQPDKNLFAHQGKKGNNSLRKKTAGVGSKDGWVIHRDPCGGTMATSRSAFAIALALACFCCARAGAQDALSSPSTAPQVLFLEWQQNGQRFEATVGEQIEIKLGAMAPCEPQISSPSLRLESVALDWPPTPGISAHTYIFDAASPGEAAVRIPLADCANPDSPEGRTFTATIYVRPGIGAPPGAYAFRTPDQQNPAPWTGAWTILGPNVLRQSFKPLMPRLTGVEVELVNANPGPSRTDVELKLLNAKGDILSVVSRSVSADDCQHVLFALPTGGWKVTPGQIYSIDLSGNEGILGWKYVVSGYKNGDASFNDKPLLRDARSTFLFRTFGAR
jgi:hypothetical protein